MRFLPDLYAVGYRPNERNIFKLALTFGFIGAGHMGFAIINAYSKSNQTPFYVYDSYITKKNTVEEMGGIFANSCSELAEKSNVILLAVKPNQVEEVIKDVSVFLTSEKCIVSVCAGISAEKIRRFSGNENLSVVTVMPNTPALIGLGASAYAVSGELSEEKINAVKTLLDSLGISKEIPADKMNNIIPVNGSSPAYIYLFSKAFIDYAVGCGIDYDTALSLFSQTLKGSAELMLQSNKPLDVLISEVATKGGTTAAGLDVLKNGNFEELVKDCAEACANRATELGK